MIKKTNVVFVLPSLVAGGAERIVSFISQNLNKENFNSKLLIIGYNKDSAYDVDNVEVTYLNKPRVLFSILSIILFLIKNKPDIVFSSISHLNITMALISFFFKKIKFIGREATISSQYKEIGYPKNKLSNFYHYLSIKNYHKLDLVVCQSKDMAKELVNNFRVPKSKTIIINNPISNLPQLNNDRNNRKNKSIKRLITVGRLSKEKGVLRLIKILPKLDFQFTYTIIGDGNEKETIFNEAKKLGVFDKIKHIPFTKDVNHFISTHDIFLQGSYVEGFPNALLESCVAGTPVIAFNVPGGTKEIVEHGLNGFLVETEEEYIKYLHEEIVWNPKHIRDSVYKKFNKEKILNEYEKMFLKVLE